MILTKLIVEKKFRQEKSVISSISSSSLRPLGKKAERDDCLGGASIPSSGR